MEVSSAATMAALPSPSSATITTPTTTAHYPPSLNLRVGSNLASNSTRLNTSPRNQMSTLRKTIFHNPHNNPLYLRFISQSAATISATAPSSTAHTVSSDRCNRWMVLIERPPAGILESKEEIIKYYVRILQSVLGIDKDPRSCIYDVSCDTHFGFCCEIDEETSHALAGLPSVLLVKPDPERSSGDKDYSVSEALLKSSKHSANGATLLFPAGSSKHCLVRMERPSVGMVTKTQMVDFYVETLTKVLGNEKDAQMCIYHVSWQTNFGFCCELDDEYARELAGIPGVLSVQPDNNFGSESKDYRGDGLLKSTKPLDPPDAGETIQIDAKKLFITGLSFYTSEKTLRAAFEPFGELVEVKVIMDKISKRSKGYAFVKYVTEEAASTALQEMNGKIINGWMITVDVAKSKPRYARKPKA